MSYATLYRMEAGELLRSRSVGDDGRHRVPRVTRMSMPARAAMRPALQELADRVLA
jgi:hypothetical protein